MRLVVTCVLLLAPLLAPAASAEQTATYLGLSPWGSSEPDCSNGPRGVSLGLGGACFGAPPEGATRFRVTIQDDATGPAYGAARFCIDHDWGSLCHVVPVCAGVAEDVVPEGATRVSVAVADPASAASLCGAAALAWAPTRGVITLDYA